MRTPRKTEQSNHAHAHRQTGRVEGKATEIDRQTAFNQGAPVWWWWWLGEENRQFKGVPNSAGFSCQGRVVAARTNSIGVTVRFGAVLAGRVEIIRVDAKGFQVAERFRFDGNNAV